MVSWGRSPLCRCRFTAPMSDFWRESDDRFYNSISYGDAAGAGNGTVDSARCLEPGRFARQCHPANEPTGAPDVASPESTAGAPDSPTADSATGAPDVASPDQTAGAADIASPDQAAGAPDSPTPDQASGAPHSPTADQASGAADSSTPESSSGSIQTDHNPPTGATLESIERLHHHDTQNHFKAAAVLDQKQRGGDSDSEPLHGRILDQHPGSFDSAAHDSRSSRGDPGGVAGAEATSCSA